MDTLQIALAVGFLIFVAVALILYAVFQKRMDLGSRLNSRTAPEAQTSKVHTVVQRIEQVARPIGQMLPRSPEEMSRQEKKLVRAGYRRKDAVILFYAAQLITGLALLTAAALTGYLYKNAILSIALSLFGGAALPDMWLKSRMNFRMRRIQFALPDAMDLAIVAVEAGLGLDQALKRVGDEIKISYPELSEELYLRNIEVNMGRTRADALRNFAERIGVEDLKALVAILIQTDRFGTSVGAALRTFSESLRVKRRQRAEEQAAKLAVKMIVPMVVFVFPAVFVVILGPAAITIVRDLLPALSGGK